MNITCGTDFSDHANAALLAAATLTARQNGVLSMVHVFDTRNYSKPSKELLTHLRDSRRKKLEALADRAGRRAAKATSHLAEGSPAIQLAEFAKKAGSQLLVVSANGQIAPTKWFVGSVMDQVVQFSSIPTMVIRNPAAIEAWAYEKRPLNVLVAYDFSASAEAALLWTAALRKVAPCEVTVAYVATAANERARLRIAPPLSPLYYPSELKKFLVQELKHKCETVFGQEVVKIYVKADWGRPDSQLLEMAGDGRVDLLVVGTSQRRGLARLGSISRAILHYAHMNVACVPASMAVEKTTAGLAQFERVLVPVDFSESAEQVVALACATVRAGGEVRLLHVVPPERRNGHSLRIKECHAESSRRLSARMGALVPKTVNEGAIKSHAAVVEHNEPAAAICQVAEQIDADLICMAARKRPWVLGAMYGSVSQGVMARSERPVLIVHGLKRESDGLKLGEELTKNGE